VFTTAYWQGSPGLTALWPLWAAMLGTASSRLVNRMRAAGAD
jgi:hypothetical protein